MNAFTRIPLGHQPTPPRGRGFAGMVSGFLGGVTAAVAMVIGAVLAVIAAAAVAFLAVVGSVLVFLTGLVLRTRRRTRATDDPQILEARKVGHAWVAYGWDQPAR
ncbi:MAG: hypothetical protein K1X35_03080 [Caulobacteraceae bacterium]|nr:hypothetical protein [Caulobacteraceae bacterium]